MRGVLSRVLRLVASLALFGGVATVGTAAAVVATTGVAGAATSAACTAPASGGTSSTFVVGVANSFSVVCYGVSGVSGQSAYPTSIVANGTLPGDASFPASISGCTQSTSGSGTTEHWIETCNVTETPTTADVGTYTSTFTASFTGDTTPPSPVTSGAWNLTVAGPSTVCTAPASGGTSTTFTNNTASSYSVVCYGTNSATADYPSSITLASGALPSDASFPNTTPGCTQSTSGSGATEHYILTCNITETPTAADDGTYTATFLATGGNGAPSTTSGALSLKVAPAAPSWATSGSNNGEYFNAVKGVPFCYGVKVTNLPAASPLSSITAGTAPSGFANYHIANVNLATGFAQICGTDNNNFVTSGTPPSMPVIATNANTSTTLNIPTGVYGNCSWTSGKGTTTVFDSNQQISQTGSQSAFGAPITNGETLGSTSNQPTCGGDAMVAAAGGLGDAWTDNTANPLPTPVDTNPSAVQGDLPSSNLFLGTGGCFGAVNIFASYSYTGFGSSYKLTTPSPWVNGGTCSYGGLGSNSAGGNTDTTNATCPPSQADVNEGYVSCSIIASSGNDENWNINNTEDLLFYNNQPVPQQPTASLVSNSALPGGTFTVTGGNTWWGSPDGAPNAGPYGDPQAGNYYQVNAPAVYIGTSRGNAVPVSSSTVSIPANSYVCTGPESNTVGPNPCTMTPGQPSGTITIPSNLTPGTYHLYIDESNTTPLPGNGPNDSFQTATGRNLGTAESDTTVTVQSPISLTKSSTTSGYGQAGDTIDYNYLVTNNLSKTMNNIGVTDSLIPNVSCPQDSLAPGASETCTGSYTVTQADVDTGSVSNTATASGTDTDSNTWTSSPSTVTVPASSATASINLTKSTTSTGYGTAGDTIPYSYLVANNGSESLSNVGVTDNKVASVDCPQGSLAPGASETCTGSYTVTQADVDAGAVSNTAQANAQDPHSNAVTSSPSSVTVQASGATSSLTLSKTSTTSSYKAAGDTIDYKYVVTNNGTVDLSNVSVNDNLVPNVDCPTSTLAPNAWEVCTGSYVVTSADVSAGSVTNLATAHASDPQSNPVSSSQQTVTVAESPSITSAATSTFTVGQSGSFQVTATGRTPVTFSETGALPSGVSLSSSGVLSGTPGPGTGGTYNVTLKADNGVGTADTQSFTLTVNEAPSITSADSTTFTVGSAGSFSATAGGYPTPTFSETGALPSGVSLSSSGVLSGTPGPGTGGTYALTLQASNGVSPDASQPFTLTVDQAPSITSAATTTFTEGHAGSFQATASGFPTSMTFSETGTLPSGVSFSSSGLLSGTPAAGTGGSYPITIKADNGVGNPDTQGFVLRVASPTTVSSVTPNSGPGAGGNTVTVAGTALKGATAVHFGTRLGSDVMVNAAGTQLTVRPPSSSASTVDVTVTTPNYGTSLTSASDQYTYLLPSISSVAPSSGPGAGGNRVTIAGSNLQGASQVMFGSHAGRIVTVASNGTYVTAKPPAHAAGTVNVQVTTPGGTSPTSASDQYTYLLPSISSVTPSSGPGAGGNRVTIAGSNLQGASQVMFGSQAGTIVSVGSLGTSAIVKPPAAAAGTVDVTVTTPGGTSAVVPADHYTYLPPSVSSVVPATGPGAGTNNVSVRGTDLKGTSQVLFGSQSATILNVNAAGTAVLVKPPAESDGTVDVTVTTPGGTSATSPADHYTYLAPTVTKLTPNHGPAAGGNTVTVSGTEFQGVSQVLFGSHAASVVRKSASSIVVTAPAGSGTVQVTVTTPGGTSATGAADRYTYS